MAAGFATRRPGMRDRAAVTPCANPSARYASVVSRVVLLRRSTAIEVGCGPETTSHPIVAAATAPVTTGHNPCRQRRRRRAGVRDVTIGRGAGAAAAYGVWRARIARIRASVSGEGVASYSCCKRRRNVSKALSAPARSPDRSNSATRRSEEHTSELQSQSNLVCRLLPEKKKNQLISTKYN